MNSIRSIINFNSFGRFSKFVINQRSLSTQSLSSNLNKNVADKTETSDSDVIFSKQMLNTFTNLQEGLFLDFTFGNGGHSQLILENFPGVRVVAVDRDPTVKEYAEALKQKYPKRLCFLNLKFSEVVPYLLHLGVACSTIDGAVIDCGPSFDQLYKPHRGFSTGNKYPLDMRMNNTEQTPTALEVLQTIDERNLYKVLKSYGQIRNAREIAHSLVQSRYQMSIIQTPDDLINFLKMLVGIESSVEEGSVSDSTEAVRSDRVHSCALTVFRALRMLVNDELNELDCAIRSAHYLLKERATLAAVTYNTLEDTVVKRHFTGMNIDASPSHIGQQQRHKLKSAGMVEHDLCLPWTDTNKHILKEHWNQQFQHSHWKSAIIRTSDKVNEVAYDS